MEFSSASIKTQARSYPSPHLWCRALERHLDHWRPWPPLLPEPGTLPCPALWLTSQQLGISPEHANQRISRRTWAAFGFAVCPHGFRDILVTAVTIDSPGQIGLVTLLLGHRAPGTIRRYYNLARGVEAAASHDAIASIGNG
jgi:hypothetical protein